MGVRDGWVEKFHDDELIVAVPQLGVVLGELRKCGVTVGDRGIEENAELGLARLSDLNGIGPAVCDLERDKSVRDQVTRYRDRRSEVHPKAPPVSELALLIEGVKLRLAQQYPGWQIAIGKNYRPSLVRGNPHTDDEGRPRPHTDAGGRPAPAGAALTGPIVRPVPHTDAEELAGSLREEPWPGLLIGWARDPMMAPTASPTAGPAEGTA